MASHSGKAHPHLDIGVTRSLFRGIALFATGMARSMRGNFTSGKTSSNGTSARSHELISNARFETLIYETGF